MFQGGKNCKTDTKFIIRDTVQCMGENDCEGNWVLFCQSFPSGSFHKPLILLCQKADRIKTTATENKSNWSHGPQPCLTQWNYEQCCVGPPKMDGSWWRVLKKHDPLEKGRQTTSVFLAWVSHEQYEKAKRYDTERWTPQFGRCPICTWRRVDR